MIINIKYSRRDSNPQNLDPKSSASANCATRAYLVDRCQPFSPAQVSTVPYSHYLRCEKDFTFITFQRYLTFTRHQDCLTTRPLLPLWRPRLYPQQLRFTLARGKSTPNSTFFFKKKPLFMVEK